MSDRGIGAWIERRARVTGDRIALVSGDVRITYAQLADRVRRLGHALRALGVERGDRVGFLGPNHPAFLEALFACAKIGAVMTPINHRLEWPAIEGICVDAAPRVIFVDPSFADTDLPASVGSRVVLGAVADPECAYESLLAGARDGPIEEDIALEDLCMLPYTSGTTGPPKGIMLTHGNVSWNVFNVLSCADILHDDVTLAIAPFFRTGGSGVNVLPVLWKGGTVVVPERIDADETLRLLEEERATIGFANPALLEAITRAPAWAEADLSSIRIFMTGGAPVPERLVRAYLARGVTFLQGYGLSEAAPVISLLDPASALGKIGSAGRPVLNVEVRVVHPDGAACGGDEVGELWVRGPNVMVGYWNRPDATARVLDERGWLRTGDAVRNDADGFLYLVGRVADAYERDGRLVHPGDAERVLLSRPEVAEACVVGHDAGAQAFIVVAEGASPAAAGLLELCADQLPAHACPTEITFVDALPRNPGGKIMRHVLRASHGPK